MRCHKGRLAAQGILLSPVVNQNLPIRTGPVGVHFGWFTYRYLALLTPDGPFGPPAEGRVPV